MAKIGTNANYITCWPNLEPILVAPPTNTSGTTYNWPNLEPIQVEFYLAGEITHVIDSIPWVRCASGNVCICLTWMIYMTLVPNTSFSPLWTYVEVASGQYFCPIWQHFYTWFCSIFTQFELGGGQYFYPIWQHFYLILQYFYSIWAWGWAIFLPDLAAGAESWRHWDTGVESQYFLGWKYFYL